MKSKEFKMKLINLEGFERTVQKEELAVNAMRIYKDGELVGSYLPGAEKRQNIYSGTKSFTSTACAFAVEEGMFSLDDFVLDYFGADAPEIPSEKLQRMKLRHLITMSMGFENPLLMDGNARKLLGKTEKDWVKYVLNTEVVHEPGTVFRYSNAAPYLLGVLIERKSGMSLVDYLTPRLFEPLGIEPPECETDPMGQTFGASSFEMNVSEYAKLGLLYLQNGVWNGKRLISEEWVSQASAPQIETDEGDEVTGRYYGYQFWIMPDGAYRADGKYGQYCIILPNKNSVVAVTAMQIENAHKIINVLADTIFPQL